MAYRIFVYAVIQPNYRSGIFKFQAFQTVALCVSHVHARLWVLVLLNVISNVHVVYVCICFLITVSYWQGCAGIGMT